MTQAKNGDTVRINYIGRLVDGTQFDSSGSEPLQFTLGEGQVIPGLETHVEGMEVGTKTTVTVPADAAYGPHRPEAVVTIDRAKVPENVNVAQQPNAFLIQTRALNLQPLDFSPVCSKEHACFRDDLKQFESLNARVFGISVDSVWAHKAFAEYQVEIDSIASQIAKARGLSATDYRAVIAELKKDQLPGDAILSHYQRRLGDIEAIVRREHLVTLPDRPARIRLATPAETAQQPAPHMVPPPLLNNTGEQGEFVLPLNVPTQPGSADTKRIDDFTFAAASWTLTSHEARPGHELQFAAMVERGVSLARSLFAFNSVNVEGWGLYAEHIMKPYEPLDGQLIALQLHLLRAARAFIDPELQSGRLTPADAMRILTHDVMLSDAFANTEVERYTFQAPGQATSYFYGYTRLLELRKDVEARLGKRFDQQRYHDFIISQGLLPPSLLRQAVMDEFVRAELSR